MLDGHIHDDHLRAFRYSVPINGGWHQPGAVMSGQKGDRLVDVTVCHRNAGIGKPTNTGRNPRDDSQFGPGLNKCLRFFATAAKDKGIAAFEAQNALVLA